LGDDFFEGVGGWTMNKCVMDNKQYGATLLEYVFLLVLIVLLAWASIMLVGMETEKNLNTEAIGDALNQK